MTCLPDLLLICIKLLRIIGASFNETIVVVNNFLIGVACSLLCSGNAVGIRFIVEFLKVRFTSFDVTLFCTSLQLTFCGSSMNYVLSDLVGSLSLLHIGSL